MLLFLLGLPRFRLPYAAALVGLSFALPIIDRFVLLSPVPLRALSTVPVSSLTACGVSWIPEPACSGKALEEKSPLGILFGFKVRLMGEWIGQGVLSTHGSVVVDSRKQLSLEYLCTQSCISIPTFPTYLLEPIPVSAESFRHTGFASELWSRDVAYAFVCNYS